MLTSRTSREANCTESFVQPKAPATARNHCGTRDKILEHIFQDGVEEPLRGQHTLQAGVCDRLRTARAGELQNPPPAVSFRAGQQSGGPNRLRDLVVAGEHNSSILNVLLQIVKKGVEDFLGSIRLGEALVCDRTGIASGENRSRQHRNQFRNTGLEYPKTNYKSNDFSPDPGTGVGRLGIDSKHALDQLLQLLPIGALGVAKERQQARNKGLFLGVLGRQLHRQLARVTGSLLNSRKPLPGRCGVLGIQPSDQAFQNHILERRVNLGDLPAKRQMQIFGNSDNDIFDFRFNHLHAIVQLNSWTA